MVSPVKLASLEFWTWLHKPKSAKSKSEIRYDMKGHQWKISIGPWFYFHCQYNHVEVTIMLFMLYYEVRYDMKDINESLAWSLILLLPLQIQSCWGHNNVAHLVLWSILGTSHYAHFAAWSEILPYPHPNPIWRGSETKWTQLPVPSMPLQIMVFMIHTMGMWIFNNG